MRSKQQLRIVGSMDRLNIHDMIPWLVYIWRCGLIRVSLYKSEIRQWARLIYWLHLEGKWHELVARSRHAVSHDTTRSLSIGVDGYHHRALRTIHSMKYAWLLSLIPVVIWFSIPNREVVAQKKVPTETILQPKEDKKPDTRFEDRWFPPSPPKSVRTIPIVLPVEEPKIDEPTARATLAPNAQDNRPNRPSIKPTRSVRYVYRDICSRHKMRKEFYNNGRSWRCRR